MQIRSDRLSVEIAEPGTVYCGSRFDWASFVTEVTLDSTHQYCASELGDSTNRWQGIGLCSEFGIFRPVGFSSTLPGECFPKLGVGLLKRTDSGPYRFDRQYEITPFPVTYAAGEDRIEFTIGAIPCRGYAAELTRTISVESNRLTVTSRLANVGERAIRTDEYAHNFTALEAEPSARACRLQTSFPLSTVEQRRGMVIDGNEIHLRAPQPEACYARFACASDERWSGPYYWELVDLSTRRGVREATDRRWSRFAVHSTSRSVSPEAFIDIDVAPGGTFTWSRQYGFF